MHTTASATQNQQSALHPVLSRKHYHQRLLWSPNRLSPIHHSPQWVHPPWLLPHPNTNPPWQHWHWGGSWTTTRKALKNHEHWTINSKHWTMNRGPRTFPSLLLLRYVVSVFSTLFFFFLLQIRILKTWKQTAHSPADTQTQGPGHKPCLTFARHCSYSMYMSYPLVIHWWGCVIKIFSWNRQALI